MAASTIVVRAITDDTGSAAAPNLDGTVLNNSWFQTLRSDINAMFAGAGAWATFTLGGLFAAEGFGTHLLSAGGTAGNTLKVRNTTAGTGNYGQFQAQADGSSLLTLRMLSTTYTTDGFNLPSGASIDSGGANGLSIGATNATGEIRFYTGGVTERAKLTAAGEFRVANGSVSTPAYSFTADPDSGFWWDNSSVFIGCGINGTEVFRVSASSGIVLRVADYGAGTAPVGVVLNRNSNASNPVAGWVQFVNQDALGYYVWVDSAADMRIGTSANLVADNGGTVVGTQTSRRDTKHLLGRFADDAGALALIQATPLYRFRYKSGAYNGQEFVGIVAEESPEFAMDAGRSFNPVSAFGYSVAALRELARRVDRLESQA